MGIGFTLLLILHVVVCLLLILLVTVQNDKGGGLAGALGGGGGAFTGSAAVTILTKLTQYVALVAFVVLLGLTYFGSRGARVTVGESEMKGASRGLSGAIQGGGAPIEGTLGPTQNQQAPLPGAAPAPQGGQ